MWNSLLDLMGSILAFFYAGVSSYGIAIIGLTIVVRLVLFPLTAKQARSMQKMQLIQPEIKKLQAKYKDDRQRLNEEVMAFYRENKINPLAGCFPLVAQMPIFFALFAVLRKPNNHVPEGSGLYKAICGTGKECADNGLRFLGMDLSEAANSGHNSFTDALPYFILIGLVAVTGYIQFKQTQARQTQSNPQMAIIGKVMPVMFAFISLSLPSGNVLYFLVSNLWQIGQQAVIFGTPGKLKVPEFEIKQPLPPEERPPTPQRQPREPLPRPERKPGGLFGGLGRRELPPAAGDGDDQPPNGSGRAAPAKKPPPSKPAPKPQAKPGPAGDNLGRAQSPGSRPKPKKKRR